MQTHATGPVTDAQLQASQVPAKSEREASEDDSAIEEFLDWPLRDLVKESVKERRTASEFRGCLDATKKIEDIREKRLDNEETDGSTIRRELVQTHVVGLLEAFSLRLLGDAPATMVRRLYADAKSGRPAGEAEETAREILSSHLSAVTTRAARALRAR